jgi:hypothetical protein
LRPSYELHTVSSSWPDIATLGSKVDAILLLSVDGRTHLEQARQAFAAKKPVFIDKPLAASLADARAIAKLAKEAGVPWFSSSSFRFGTLADTLKAPDVMGVIAWGPGPTEEHHALDLSWYGIHTVELLFTLMGRGCESVSMLSTTDSDVVTGVWRDGRVGTVRLARPSSEYGAVVFRPKQVIQSDPKLAQVGYEPMLKLIVEFFRTGKPRSMRPTHSRFSSSWTLHSAANELAVLPRLCGRARSAIDWNRAASTPSRCRRWGDP